MGELKAAEASGTQELPVEDATAVYSSYLDERKALTAAEQAQSQLFDRTAITLSGGALGLSLTFIAKVLGARPPLAPWILYLSWLSLVLAVLCTLASFQFSVRAYQRQRDILDAEYQGDASAKNASNRWSVAVGVVNWAALGLIVGGFALLSIFVGLNTWR